MEIGRENQQAEELRRTEAITVPDSDSVEQDEPHLNDELDAVTNNPTEVGNTEEQRPDDGLRQNEPSPKPQRPVFDNAPTEPALHTLS